MSDDEDDAAMAEAAEIGGAHQDFRDEGIRAAALLLRFLLMKKIMKLGLWLEL